MDKISILFVGEHPFSCTGNGNMLSALLDRIDDTIFDVSVFVIESRPVEPSFCLKPLPFRFFPAAIGGDAWGGKRLASILSTIKFDIVFMVGIDIWRYYKLLEDFARIRSQRGFKWGWLFPYDLQSPRKDWTNWMNLLDFPCVYSQYGYDTLFPLVPRLQYFRPPLNLKELYKVHSEEKREALRRELFPNVDNDYTLFGFVGPNQFRKDPQGLLTAFRIVNEKYPKTRLYMHTNVDGSFNLQQHIEDEGIEKGRVFIKRQGSVLHPSRMADLYNCFDCLVNCSMQEGLSWTPLEAMLCGTPVIASETTSQTEMVNDAAIMVPCNHKTWIPMIGSHGETMVESFRCDPKNVAVAMEYFISDPGLKVTMRQNGLMKAESWCKGVSDVNEVLKGALQADTIEVKEEKIEAVLFMQHSAAGDVFMTTRCLPGIKKRHPDLPLHYMTQDKYKGIIEGNPFVDKVLGWDEEPHENYRIIYNIHGEKILPGHWGRNCNSILSDFYWRLLHVEPSEFFISEVEPKGGPFPKNLALVHTTGGDPEFRTYQYMAEVCEWLHLQGFTTIQVGGREDYPAGAAIDARGKFTYRETAWIAKRSKMAVTVDSFVSHLCGALGVSQVCLFGSGNYVVVRPRQMQGILVCMVPDYIYDCKGLGPCSASVRDCPAPCTGKHDPGDIIDSLKYILERLPVVEDSEVVVNQKGAERIL